MRANISAMVGALALSLAITASGFLLLAGAASAAEGQKDAKAISYSFEGPFGTFDKAELQRGYKVYKEVCSNCHSMRLVSFRNLSEHGWRDRVAFARDHLVTLQRNFNRFDAIGFGFSRGAGSWLVQNDVRTNQRQHCGSQNCSLVSRPSRQIENSLFEIAAGR